jgi:hypothetical protein
VGAPDIRTKAEWGVGVWCHRCRFGREWPPGSALQWLRDFPIHSDASSRTPTASLAKCRVLDEIGLTRLGDEYGFQYIVTINSDRLAAAESEGFDRRDYVIDPVLTDYGDDGGLLGFRFV